MGRPGTEIIASEARSKYIQSRIIRSEYDLGRICETLASFTRKMARLRDKGDQLCIVLRDVVNSEMHAASTKDGIGQFTELFALLQDYRHAEVQRLDSNVVRPLCSYGSMCKDAKVQSKNALLAIKQEKKIEKTLKKASDKFPANNNLLHQIKSEAGKASLQSIRTTKDLQNSIEALEKKKLFDLRAVLLNFINIEMSHHSKSLEIYSNCFNAIDAIQPAADFAAFTQYLFDLTPQVIAPVPAVMLTAPEGVVDVPVTVKPRFTCTVSPPPSPRPFHALTATSLPQPQTPTPYSLVNTNGILHYKMKEDIEESLAWQNKNETGVDSGSLESGDHVRIANSYNLDNDENDDELEDESTKKKVKLNRVVQVVNDSE